MIKNTERKDEMIEMRKKGIGYENIGKAFGISKQRVYQIIGADKERNFKGIKPSDCLYPNLRQWMNDNHITRKILSNKLYGDTHTVHCNTVSNFMKGKHGHTTKNTIDRYLKITGLTYEELFETDKE